MATRQQIDKATFPGIFLVASPHCAAPYRRSVVLLLAHGRDGAHGILLNDQVLDAFKVHTKVLSGHRGDEIQGSLVFSKLPLIQWPAGQLELEYQNGVWMTTPASVEPVPDTMRASDLWAVLVRRIGRAVLSDSLDIKHFPPNPLLN